LSVVDPGPQADQERGDVVFAEYGRVLTAIGTPGQVRRPPVKSQRVVYEVAVLAST
jgi:hypothetical protein